MCLLKEVFSVAEIQNVQPETDEREKYDLRTKQSSKKAVHRQNEETLVIYKNNRGNNMFYIVKRETMQ